MSASTTRSRKRAVHNNGAAGPFRGGPTETQLILETQPKEIETAFGLTERGFNTPQEEMNALAHIFADVYLEHWNQDVSWFENDATRKTSKPLPLVQ